MALGPVLDYWRGRAGKPAPAFSDWTQQELAQFYRVEWALGQAGISVETDRGLSDEGDPWFAFCRASDAEVVIHIAREGDTYLLAGFLSDRIQRGRDFSELVERLLAQHPAKSIDKRGQGNVVMHPATMLALLISIAFLQSNEGKADTVSESHDEAGLLRGLSGSASVQTGVNLRSATVLGGTMVALAATFELAQAMTILRVANLMDSDSSQQGGGDDGAALHKAGDGGWAVQAKRGAVTEMVATGQLPVVEAHASGMSDAASASLHAAQSGIDHLLEIVAKLWTIPDSGPVMSEGLGLAAARAFFSSASNGVDDFAAALRMHPQARTSGEVMTGNVVKQVAAVDGLSTEPTLTIIQATGSSDSMAQTILKLSFAGQNEVVIKADSLGDAGKAISVVSELVAHAKGETTSGLGSALHADVAGRLVQGQSSTDKLLAGLDTKIDLAPVTDKGEIAQAYTTRIGDGVVKHDVLNSFGQASVERAIAAFKEDVGHFKVMVDGKDVVFFNPDAGRESAPNVVIELWQFKDGSSIALVGFAVDGYLPYSL